MSWDMIPSSGIMTIPSSEVIAVDNRRMHEKINQLEKWLLLAMESAEFEFPEEMVEWKATYINRKKLERDERIVYLQERIQKILDELKELQDES